MNEQEESIVLDIQDLTVHFVLEDETVRAVNHISMQLRSGRNIGLVGETGAGKTSTALAILNMVPDPPGVIKSGRITVCGNDMLSMKPDQLEKIRGNDVSMIFQDPMTALNPVFSVGDQIAESIHIHEGLSKASAYKKAQDMLEMVGIPRNRASDYPYQFSGGMKQRVVIAIALSCNPKLLIADEPTTALDVTIQAQVLALMNQLRYKYNTAMIMITHNLGIVAEICDEVAVMYAGSIVEKGTLEDVFNQTTHPYTEGLFNSLPNIKNRKAKLQPIQGLMPDPTQLPIGCAFAPRCTYVMPECIETPQCQRMVSETHSVMCSAYNDPAFHIKRGM